MFRICLCLFINVIFVNLFLVAEGNVPTNRLCANSECSGNAKITHFYASTSVVNSMSQVVLQFLIGK